MLQILILICQGAEAWSSIAFGPRTREPLDQDISSMTIATPKFRPGRWYRLIGQGVHLMDPSSPGLPIMWP